MWVRGLVVGRLARVQARQALVHVVLDPGHQVGAADLAVGVGAAGQAAGDVNLRRRRRRRWWGSRRIDCTQSLKKCGGKMKFVTNIF